MELEGQRLELRCIRKVRTETALMQRTLRITDGLKMSTNASIEVIFLGLQFLEFVQAKLSHCNGIFKVVRLEMSC